MTKKLMGLFASVALMSSGMAFAHDKADKDKQTQTQSGTGGSGNQTMGQQQSGQLGQTGQVGQTGMSDQLGGNQLTGRVVKSDKKTIWVEHAGAVVPLKIDKNTQFTDPSFKRATDIKEGAQIRASFEVRKTENIATSIGMSSDMGQGGSGSEALDPNQGINQQPMDAPLPPAGPGTGGSGPVEEGDINEGISPDSSLDTAGDVSSDQDRSAGDR